MTRWDACADRRKPTTCRTAAIKDERSGPSIGGSAFRRVCDCNRRLAMMRPVLKAAEYSYTAGKCSPSLRELAVRGECSVMRQTYRNGLLAAVRRRLGFFHTPDDLQ